ncbi:MAG: ankyrin repeat domain-containing protein [Bacteroidota bacterium]
MAKEDLFGKLGDFINRGTQSIRDRLTLDVTDLLRAIDDNNIPEVERALNAAVDPNKTDGLGQIPLILACNTNNDAIAARLLKAGANPNVRGRDGQTPLYKAIGWENPALIRRLLEAGADIHLPNDSGLSPYEEAKNKGYTNLLALMDQYHSAARQKQRVADRKRHEAQRAKAEKVRQRKAEAEERQQKREERSKERSIRRKYKIKEDSDPLYAVIQAIRENDEAAALFLLDKVADINSVEATSGLTPLMAAIQEKNNALCAWLLEREADVFVYVAAAKHSALTYGIVQQYYALVETMLDQPVETLSQALNDPKQLLSPQFLAYKDPRMLDLLLKAGANPYFGGQVGSNPVVKAIEKASVAILPVLVRHSIDLNQVLDGKTLLGWAIHFQREDWLVGLLKENVDSDTVNAQAQTPLMLAVQANLPDYVELLLEAHADPTLRDAKGQTALDMAKANGEERLVSLLTS